MELVRWLLGLGKASVFFLTHLSVVIVFATLYWIIHVFVSDKSALSSTHKKKEELTWFDCFYFSIVTQTTVGYGDITAVEPLAKAVNILQLLSVYGVVTYGIFGA